MGSEVVRCRAVEDDEDDLLVDKEPSLTLDTAVPLPANRMLPYTTTT